MREPSRAGWAICAVIGAACLGCGGDGGSASTFESAEGGDGVPADGSATGTEGNPAPDDDDDDDDDDPTGPGACVCDPGETMGCASSSAILECADDCSGFVERACSPFETCMDDACVEVECEPGESICHDDGSVRVCNEDGSGFGEPTACGDLEACAAGACASLCDVAEADPSSVGCSFFALNMDNYYAVDADALVVGNPSAEHAATVQLWRGDGLGGEVADGAPVVIAAGEVAQLELAGAEVESGSAVVPGGSFRVSSDLPVVAYQHAPIGAQATNDASMLLPEHALARDHVVASYPASFYAGNLAYFDVVAAHDGTTVTWTSPVATLAGDGVPAVAAGDEGSVVLDRHDTLQVAAAFGEDVSGTVVEADQPIWVMGASACPSVPVDANTCDHIEEQMLPIAYWGTTYVAPHAPLRDSESYHWRIFAGDSVTITTTPDQTGGGVALARGEYVEIVTDESFVVEADGPVLPVQYLESQNEGAGTGDPAMIQLVPAEQFLDRYAFATGTGYDVHYVQVIRAAGAPDVFVDGVAVAGFAPVGDGFEVADWEIDEGSHFAESRQAFGIVAYGYTTITSYGYPGGLRLMTLNPEG